MMRRVSAVLFSVLLFAATSAHAQSESFRAFGPHLGFSMDPDQVVVGGHMGFGNVAPSLDFVPSVDLGLGDHLTVISFNGDFHYRFDVSTTWQPYAGAGVALHAVSADDEVGGGSDTFGGGSFIFGADVPTQRGSRFYVEGRFGLGDTPDFKLIAGWSFPMR